MNQRVVASVLADTPNRRLIAVLAALAGVTADGGAVGLFMWRGGNRYLPHSLIEHTLALPFSFAPGPFVDESTPAAAHVVLWGCGGLLMAFIMAQTTWQGVHRLLRASPEGVVRTLEVS